MSERKLRVCMNAVLDDPDDVDGLCSGFQSIRECLTSNLKDCFPEDYVQKITKDFFCQKLKQIPDKSFSENVENNYFIDLEVKTDNN